MKNNNFLKLQGQLSINRVDGGSGEGYVSITITDKTSALDFVQVTISFEDFAKCVLGRSYVNCDLEVCGLDKIGKVLETKTEIIEVFNNIVYAKDRKEKTAEILKPFEKDGWVGCESDLFNHHKRVTSNNIKTKYQVGFKRWVDKP